MHEVRTDGWARQARSAGLLEGVTPESSQRLLIAGVELFSTVGFHATTTRDLAQRAGMSPSALYIHYRSKSDLLAAIIISSHQSVVLELEDAAVAAGGSPVDRFGALVRTFVHWQADHIAVARIGVQHLDSLDEEHFAAVRRSRGTIVGLFETALREGVARGDFEVQDIHDVALAVISLGLDLTRWYSPARSRTAAQLAELYADLATRMVSRRSA